MLAQSKTTLYLTPKEVDTKVINVNTIHPTGETVGTNVQQKLNIEV
jgi:hypothetical protein